MYELRNHRGFTKVGRMNEPFQYCIIPSPVGELLIAGDSTGLKVIDFQAGPHPRTPLATWVRTVRPFEEAVEQLNLYFAGQLREFTLPLAPEGTPFQLRVWQALRTIPYGTTVSYSEIASRIGRPRAMRAVGAANGHNPISIVIPCHRVIGKTGALVGYGGGLAIKQALLAHERRVLAALSESHVKTSEIFRHPHKGGKAKMETVKQNGHRRVAARDL